MRETNIIEINQEDMLKAIDLWLADQFKIPPRALFVSELRDSSQLRGGSGYNGFKIEIEYDHSRDRKR